MIFVEVEHDLLKYPYLEETDYQNATLKKSALVEGFGPDNQPDIVFYNYRVFGNDTHGGLFARKGALWGFRGLSHCFCCDYRPWHDLDTLEFEYSLDDLKNHLFLKPYRHIWEAAKYWEDYIDE